MLTLTMLTAQRSRPGVVAVIAVAMLVGCQQPDRSIAPKVVANRPATARAVVTGSAIPRPGEARFLAIAKQEPEFAGYFFDRNHNLIVYVRDSTRFSAVGAVLGREIATDHLGLPPWYNIGAIQYRKGDYDFQQLSDWRDSVTLRVLGTVRGVYSSDLDEVLNRVTIGADSSEATAAEAAAIGILISLSVPVAAIHFSLGRQPVSSIGVANARSLAHAIYEAGDTSLRDDGTALAGGFEIDRSLGGNRYELCTAGLVITRNSTTYLVTASHCSSTMYNLDTGDDLYQVDAGRAIGHEAWDTTASGDDPKRNSDAALITVDTMTALRGVIARTTSRSYDTYGRIQIDTTRPYLYVYTTSSEPPVGTYVDKIGRSTGWTYGDVSGTCVDMENTETDKIIACTTKANVFTGKGDSGAALFGWDGEDGADLNGLTVCLFESAGTEVIAGDSIQYGYVSYYSGYTGFLADLGGSSGVSATAGVTISSVTDSGTVSISNPAVSWSVPTIGGSGSASATRYYLYRSTSAGEYDDQIGTYYDGTDWLDLDETVTGYNGTTRPGIHTPWVEYQVVAYNDGVTNSSTPIYFTQ